MDWGLAVGDHIFENGLALAARPLLNELLIVIDPKWPQAIDNQ
jgi:hypothetical protein